MCLPLLGALSSGRRSTPPKLADAQNLRVWPAFETGALLIRSKRGEDEIVLYGSGPQPRACPRRAPASIRTLGDCWRWVLPWKLGVSMAGRLLLGPILFLLGIGYGAGVSLGC